MEHLMSSVMHSAMDPVYSIRSLYVLMATSILFADAIPGLKLRFVRYGARTSTTDTQPDDPQRKGSQAESQDGTIFSWIFDRASRLTVPHSWFIHFYVLSTTLSLFWTFQILAQGDILQSFVSSTVNDRATSMSQPQIMLLLIMMTLQGGRRLAECLTFRSASASQMWIAHWAIGLVFYFLMNLAIWVEGIPVIVSHKIQVGLVVHALTNWRSLVAIPVFLLASGVQHDCHAHLASLKKYSLPSHPIFELLVCPHYTAECVIYLSMAFAGAPPGAVFNGTIMCGLLFVIVNLGVTAAGTRTWYASRFGEEAIKDRWNLVPFIW